MSFEDSSNEEAVKNDLRQIVLEKYKKGSFVTNERIVDFSEILKEKYGAEKLKKCELYHLLIGSTPPAHTDFYDLEGEDSIEAFIRKL